MLTNRKINPTGLGCASSNTPTCILGCSISSNRSNYLNVGLTRWLWFGFVVVCSWLVLASSQHQINLWLCSRGRSFSLKAAVSKTYTNHSRTGTQMAGGINNPLQTSSRRINLSNIRHAQCRVFRMHTRSKEETDVDPFIYPGTGVQNLPLQYFMSRCCQQKDIWINSCILGNSDGPIQPAVKNGIY